VFFELILPIYILKRATRWKKRFLRDEQVARSCSRWRASNKRCAVSLGSAQCLWGSWFGFQGLEFCMITGLFYCRSRRGEFGTLRVLTLKAR